MVSSCVVTGCTQRFSKDSKILFHRFPTKNPSLCRKWLRAIHREDLNEGNLKYARICSLHFHKNAYLVSNTNKMKLKSEVVPQHCPSGNKSSRQLRKPVSAENITSESKDKDAEPVEQNEEEPDMPTDEEASDSTEVEEESDKDGMSDSDNSDEENKGVHFQVKEFRSMVPAQFTTSSGDGGMCYVLVWNPDDPKITNVPTAIPNLNPPAMPSDMSGMENRIKELESQISHLVDSNTRLNQQVELLSESNKDLKKKLKTLQQNKRRLLKRLNTMEGMVNDWKDDRKPFSFCFEDV